MSATGLDVFDKTVQTTNVWLNEISEEIGPDRQLAWHVLGVGLRTLRDRLPVDDAAHLGAELPLMIRVLTTISSARLPSRRRSGPATSSCTRLPMA